MPDESSRLIDAGSRPFHDDAEQEMAARRMLGELGTEETGAAEVLARWQAVDRWKRKGRWRAGLLYALLFLVSAGVLGDTAVVAMRWQNLNPTWGGDSLSIDLFHNSGVVPAEEMAAKLAPDDALLLYGDLTKSTKSDRLKALWDSAPGNAAFFAVYANAYLEDHRVLPRDFLETARRIDPDNAWFTCVAAGVRGQGSFRTPARWARDGGPVISLPDWDVTDPAALKDALALLEDARSQPEMESYRTEVGRARAKLLPDGTPAEVTATSIYHRWVSPADLRALADLGRAMGARAWLCGEEEDPAAFEILEKEAGWLLSQLTGAEVDSMWGESVIEGIALDYLTCAVPAARKLGLTAAVDRLEPTRVAMQAFRDARQRGWGRDFLYLHGRTNTAMVGDPNYQWYLNAPFLTEKDVTPGRLMDHETLAWGATQCVWAVLVVAMGAAWLSRYRSPRMVRRLCGRLEELVLARDWLMILGLGVGMPVLYFLGVTRWTELGGRGMSLSSGSLRFAPDFPRLPLGLVQQIGLAWLVIYSAAAAACWRLGRRTRPFRLRTGISWSLLVPVACLAAFIPVSGWAALRQLPWPGVYAGWLGAIGVGWVVPVGLVFFTGGLRTQLRQGAVGRMLVPAYGFAALLAIGAAPIYKAAAYRWSAADTLMRRDRDHPADTIYQHKKAVESRKELRQALGYGPH